MKLLADLHTHSNFSRWRHGKNSIQEIAITANEMGLKEVAITDHGYKHFFRTSKENIKKAREIIDEINSWSSTKVLLGIEADILDEAGNLDIDNETLDYLDILLVGYHPMIKTDFAGFFGHQGSSKDAVQKATNAFLNAMDKYPITILTHLNARIDLDLYKIGCACAEKNIMVELNSRHPYWTEKQMNDLIASGCMFVVNSDAHERQSVGHTNEQFELLKKYKIPNVYVSNVEYSPEEKTEEDDGIDVYYGIYKRKKDQIEDKIKVQEEKEKTEFTSTLSPEMEEALQKIAEEKGLNYKNPKQTVDYDKLKAQVDEEFEIEMRARKLDNRKIKEKANSSFDSEINIDSIDDFSEDFGTQDDGFVGGNITETDFEEMRSQIDVGAQEETQESTIDLQEKTTDAYENSESETITPNENNERETDSLDKQNETQTLNEVKNTETQTKNETENIKTENTEAQTTDNKDSDSEDLSENIIKQFERLGRERKNSIETNDESSQNEKNSNAKRYEKDVKYNNSGEKKPRANEQTARGYHIAVVNENIDEMEKIEKSVAKSQTQNVSKAELSQKKQRSKFKPLAILDVDGANDDGAGDKLVNGDGTNDDTKNGDKK